MTTDALGHDGPAQRSHAGRLGALAGVTPVVMFIGWNLVSSWGGSTTDFVRALAAIAAIAVAAGWIVGARTGPSIRSSLLGAVGYAVVAWSIVLPVGVIASTWLTPGDGTARDPAGVVTSMLFLLLYGLVSSLYVIPLLTLFGAGWALTYYALRRGWTSEPPALESVRRPASPKVASPRRRWATGLLVGLVVGVGVLIGGFMVGLIGIAAVVLLAAERGRDAPTGGLLTGFGAAWLALFLRADASCGNGCTGPDLTPWFAFAAVMLLLGIVLTVRTFRVKSPGSLSGTGPARPADVIWFNWPPFVVGSTGAGLALIVAFLPLPTIIRAALVTGAIATFACIASAIAAVLWVFGVGAAKRWQWVRDHAATPNRWLNVTTGFDDSSATLRTLLAVGQGESIDVFDTSERPEAPLRRARNRFPPVGTSRAVAELAVVLPDAAFDVIFLLMAAHEAHGDDLTRLFDALARALTNDGRMILVEHLRDVPNTIAFGPGARHFQTRATWLETSQAAGLVSVTEAPLSPFVRGFVFVRASGTVS